MFWDNYLKLCTEKKSSPNKVAAELGFSNATCTQWKKKGSTPGGANLKKLADYFGVSTDFLIANNEISQIDPDAEVPAPARINENELSRPPHGGRGLKSQVAASKTGISRSSSTRGTWIEIS